MAEIGKVMLSSDRAFLRSRRCRSGLLRGRRGRHWGLKRLLPRTDDLSLSLELRLEIGAMLMVGPRMNVLLLLWFVTVE